MSAADKFDACQNRAGGRHISLNYVRYGADVTINPGELSEFYLIQIPLAGGAEVENGRQSVLSTRKMGTVLNPDRATNMRWHAGCEQVLLQVEQGFMHEVASRMSGVPVGPIRFSVGLDLRRSGVAAWADRLRGVFRAAEEGLAFSAVGDCRQDHLEEALVASLLDCQPNTASPLLERLSFGTEPAILKRAVALISERFSEDLGLLDICTHARTTPRNLQIQFKRAFSCGPVQYLQEVRLTYARHLLLTSSGNQSIAEIAFISGHRHFGRFSVAYKKRFGESPRQTRALGRFN